jgi:exodeoxyribonuclease V beta subunit
LDAYFNRYLQILHHDLLTYCNTELPRRKRREQTQSYDDLLLNLRTALQTPGRGAQLAESIRNRYRAALIDEFQDTDPIQYDIFTSIYKDSGQPVFLVGDPKQAIYSFRGADIFAYLRAKQEAGDEYTLATNWRSDPGLITAFNALFGLCPNPFLLPEIPFHPVQAADLTHPRLVTPGDDRGPLRIWFMGQDGAGKPLNKGVARPRIAGATAGTIAGLLNQGERGEAYLEHERGRRPLRGSDMAVLVRNHRQAGEIRRALLALGVPSVEQSRDSVFETPEALELERVLLAVVTPRREERLRAALVTDVLGLSAAVLHGLLADERDWERLLLEFHGYHQLWREQGFIRMFRNLLVGRDVYRRLLGFRDGERRMTNLLHLAELLQEASVNQRLGMEGLVQWLAAQRAEPAADQETQQLRLESDADLVQIVTIHKSKGLEYPIVFCPFLWDAKLWSASEDIISFHDPDRDNVAVLDMGSEARDWHRGLAEREELAEELRLAYVALTRAKYRCYTVWGSLRDGEKSALAWLLYRPPVVQAQKDLHGAHREYVKGLNAEALLSGLQRLAAQGAGTVQVSPLPTQSEPYQPRRADGEAFRARYFAGEPRLGWRFSSFTALQERRGGELPDYDGSVPTAAAPADTAGRNIFTFPQGARAGRCLHAIFEQIDFTQGDEPLMQTTRSVLRKYGFASEWVDVVAQMVRRVLQVPLDPGGSVTLGGVGRAQRLTELAFMYRFASLDAQALKGLLSRHGEHWAAALESAAFRLGEGFMRGFIDLAFAAGERVYLVDYKSNWLGLAPEDYGQRALARAMAAGGYHLQYLIYTVALHRYLKWRRPGYDYDRHFGGVRYLFLRGMDPRDPRRGVYAVRPPADLVAALDVHLSEREVRSA